MARLIHTQQNESNPSKQDSPPENRERIALELVARFSQQDLSRGEVQGQLLADLCALFDTQAAAILTTQEPVPNLLIHEIGTGGLFILEGIDLDWEKGWIENAMLDKTVKTSDRYLDQAKNTLLEPLAKLNMPYCICAPLIAADESIGCLIVLGNALPYRAEDQTLLAWIASTLAHKIPYQHVVSSLQFSRNQLLHSRNVLRALFDSFPDSLYIVDLEYTLTAVNMARARRTQQHPNQLVGKCCYQALFNLDAPCTECRIKTTLKSGDNTTRTRRDRQSNGEIKEWEIYSYPIKDGEEKVMQAILLEQDITDKLHLELTLAQSEKLAAMGQWAASLAHEINNPLTAIIANAQLLKREIPAEDDRQELVDLIARAGERANQVVRNMLDLARKDEYLFGPTDINQTIRRSLDFLQHELAAREINFIYQPAGSLPLINASPDHLQGVWLNMLTNAMDSTEDLPGEIRVSTAQHGNDVHVVIEDNGRGISPEELERIFEPFFTTKAHGRGTGLGLPVCQRIIKQHGGRILVESQSGEGTRFTVILPVQ
jgi:two-component system NtrC family sensor kinase